MNKIIITALSCILALLLLLPCTAKGSHDGEIHDILSYISGKHSESDIKSWAENELFTGINDASDWYIFSLAHHYGDIDLSNYKNALLDLTAKEVIKNPAERRRHALALVACGHYDGAFLSSVMSEPLSGQGVMSVIFDLHLLNNGLASPEYTEDDVINALLSLKKSDGGWGVVGNHSDIDTTAMALQALAPHKIKSEVGSAVDTALSLLSSKQQDSGGFINYGIENCESSAQVITALSSLGIELNDGSFVKNGKTPLDAMLSFKKDGGFSHSSEGDANPTASYQALTALVSLSLSENGKGSYYIFDKRDAVSTDESENNTVTEADTAENKEDNSIKLKTAAVIGITALSVCAVMFILGKRRLTGYILTAVIAGAVIIFLLLSDIKLPEDYYGSAETKTDITGSVKISITCRDAVGKTDAVKLPEDGIILPETEVIISKDESVFDILAEVTRLNSIKLEYEGGEKFAYVKGIAGLYEFDVTSLSGWEYRVNGERISLGCSEVKVSDGDIIEWYYTLSVGSGE